MADKPKLYLGRPINLFNTSTDSTLLKVVAKFFPEFEIEDPAQKKHGEGYVKYKSLKGTKYNGRIVQSGMDYYYQELLPTMAAGAFIPFRDGMLGKGVYGEAECLNSLKKPIYEVHFDWAHLDIMAVSDLTLDPSRCLTVEQTQARVYIDGDFKKGSKSFFED